MKKILVQLVSDQTSPNVLSIRELKDVDEYLFISTEQMKEKQTQIVRTTGLGEEQYKTILVDAVSPKNINEELEGHGFSHLDEYIVNLTCGTKIMALATFQFFSQFDKVRMLYFGSEDKTYQFIHPTIEEPQPILHQMNIREFLSAYGVEILGHKTDFTRSVDFTRLHFEKFMKGELIDTLAYETIKKLRNRKSKGGFIRLSESENESLQEIGFIPENEKKLTLRESEFIRGKWLEEYVFDIVRKKTGWKEEQLVHGFKIRHGTNYELDVFFMHNNTPYCIECKTSFPSGEEYSKIIYKLSAARRILGLDLKTVLVVLTDVEKRFEKYLDDHPFVRAEKHRVKVVDRKAIEKGELETYINSILE